VRKGRIVYSNPAFSILSLFHSCLIPSFTFHLSHFGLAMC
jgi:hypothetical protein